MSFYTTHFAYATEDWSSAVRQKPAQEEDPSIEVLPEELRPVVDMSKLRLPAYPARRRAWSYWTRRAWSYWTS